jgi:renalase
MATRDSPFGTFDHGAQYFTVRDARFAQALETTPGLCKPLERQHRAVCWTSMAALPPRPAPPEPHWVAVHPA